MSSIWLYLPKHPHWVPKEIGYAKVARALKANGYQALF